MFQFQIIFFQVCNGSQAEPYTNPRAPVHMIVGSAVCYHLYYCHVMSLLSCLLLSRNIFLVDYYTGQILIKRLG